jgi:glyoxylase-like metal-dependent hydrolase (beta-lactamase superfamily II)
VAVIGLALTFASLPLTTITLAQQSPNLSEQSYRQAREALEAGIKALGGLEALQSINDITREMSGSRIDQGQGLQPAAHFDNEPKATSIRDLRGQRAMEHSEARLLGGQPRKFRSVLTPNALFATNYVIQMIYPRPATAIPQAKAGTFRRYPESLLQTARNRPEMLRWLGDAEFEGHKQRVISFADSDGVQVALYFDAQTNLLTKSETLGDDTMFGDIPVEVIYRDYRQVEKVMLPFRYTSRGGSVTEDLKASSIVINTRPADSLFAMPEGFAKADQTPPANSPVKLADDVYAMLGGYNSVFVVFNDYVLVLEAGGGNNFTQSLIGEIKKIAPNKPIRYLVSTHFHFDHLSGVRNFIAEGTIIVTTPTAKGVIEQIAKATHQRRPDNLSRNPKSPVIETFTGKRVLEDGSHKVELYEFSSPHCGEIIICYLPKEKILLEADLLDLDVLEGGTAPAGEDTADLADKIQKLGLQVERIVPIHGRIGTIEDLLRAVSKRTTTVSSRQ